MGQSGWLIGLMEFMSLLFIFVVGSTIAALVVLYIIDRTQRTQAIRHNYPVVGRLRYLLEHLGKFFRQYFFAMDREELPFNRAQRSFVYRASKDLDTTASFGSTRDLTPVGSVFFVNCPFPTLATDAATSEPLVIGPQCPRPYAAPSLFNISGMSYGAVSKPAVQALTQGAARAGCWLNTGEGGLSPYHLEAGCDLVFQIGTAKYGVRTPDGRLDHDRLRDLAALAPVRMFEIKLSQGAKPGKGGLLPGRKVTEEVARIRGIPVGLDSLSPNRHVEVDSVPDLLDLITDVRATTGKPTGIKFVVGAYGWLETLCQEILERGPASAPDFVTVDGADGGSGAAPGALMDSMGLPLRESLPMVIDILERYALRERVRVIASGKLVTPTDVAWSLCVGADFAVSARGFMFALGCIQSMQCNKDTCPTGITTHNPRLQQGLDPARKSVRVAHYVTNTIHEVEVIAHSCGVREPRELERFHARIVASHGQSIPLDAFYPTLREIDQGRDVRPGVSRRLRPDDRE
ncbi:FMN-binding glutamate synthase family protein [Thioalkalivibrio sp.]|uniref:FMN-binding glutamate synthase family protein n=1 Tax=Thioalkalivibrio sp. TaxID=2093813 RepID=UPI003564C242